FIVPSQFLNALLESASDQPLARNNLKLIVANQVLEYENRYMSQLINQDWPSIQLRELKVPGAISPTVRCWDNSNKLNDNLLYRRFQIHCANKNHVYLDSQNRFVGDLIYQYFWLETDELNPIRFYNLYEKLNKDQIDNKLSEEQVSNFNCDVWFVNISGKEFKTNICRREYVEYEGMSDVLFTAALTGHDNKGFFITLNLTGVSYQSSLPLIQKFIEQVEWTN
ncbi:MAG: serine protease Do, partial [Gammaproteobacteria bacterium]